MQRQHRYYIQNAFSFELPQINCLLSVLVFMLFTDDFYALYSFYVCAMNKNKTWANNWNKRTRWCFRSLHVQKCWRIVESRNILKEQTTQKKLCEFNFGNLISDEKFVQLLLQFYGAIFDCSFAWMSFWSCFNSLFFCTKGRVTWFRFWIFFKFIVITNLNELKKKNIRSSSQVSYYLN